MLPGLRLVGRGQRAVVDLIIVGGESGASARAMHPAWARGLRDQCASAGVPFHFKQWGEWAPSDDPTHWVNVHGTLPTRPLGDGVWGTDAGMKRLGVKRAGFLLDDVEHREHFND